MNPIQPTKKLTIGEDAFHLIFDFDAIAEAEDLLERPILSGITKRDFDAPRINMVRAFFYASTRKHHPDVSYEQIKKMVTAKTLSLIWGVCLSAWAESMAEPEEITEGDEKNAERHS